MSDTNSPILVSTDLSEHAGIAARWGERLGEHMERPVVVVHVVEASFTNWYEGKYEVLDDQNERDKACQRVAAWYRNQTGVAPDEVDLRVGTPHRQLAESADERDAEILAISVSGKGAIGKLAFGSTALELTREPPCPVAIVHPDHDDPGSEGELMVGTDFSPTSEPAFEFAAALADLLERTLHVVHSSQPMRDLLEDEPLLQYPEEKQLSRDRGELLKETLDRYSEGLEDVTIRSEILDERPSRGFCHYLETNDTIDIAILSDRFHGGSREALLSSVALKCVQLMESTVVVVPGGA